MIGLIKSFYPNLDQTIFPNYINSILGGLVGYFLIWLVIIIYEKIRKKEGMGLGDAKLLAAIGFWFGWVSIPFTIFISSFVALIFVIPSRFLIRQEKFHLRFLLVPTLLLDV